jgi:tRNA threonylcarbamoyladenosine biosynthesis protein TsaE
MTRDAAGNERDFRSSSVERTREFGRQWAAGLGRGDLVALVGPLGAGKTALVRGLAEGLGLEGGRGVASPTFVLVHEYPGRVRICHIDLYRMADPEVELIELGLLEMLSEGAVLIEWADRAERALPRPYWRVEIEPTGRTSRRIRVRRV